MIVSTVSIIRASIQHCHRCEHYSSFAELKIIGRKTWNSPKPKDLCGPDVTMPHVAMNDSMPRGLRKTHSVYHQAKPVSNSSPGDLFPWSLTLIMWDLLILKFMNSQSNLFQICFISRVLDFCPGNALFQLRNIWVAASSAHIRFHHHCHHHHY